MAHNYCTCWGNRGSCIDCAEEEIDRLTAQLAERDDMVIKLISENASLREEVEKLRHQSINWVTVFDANMELQTQNATLRGEVERYKAGVEVEGQLVYPCVVPNITIWLPFNTDLKGYEDGQSVRVLITRLEG